jgi:F-type H+-transporting ATPase subunit delta
VRESTIARSYADALFALGEKDAQLEPYGAAQEMIAGLLEREPKLRLFLESPKVEPSKKKRVLTEALQGQVPPLVLNFLLVVLDKRRQRLIPQIAREYRVLLDESLGRLYAEVTVAREPDEKMEREIAAGLSQALGKTVIPHIQVDPSILGGIIVRYGDRVLDGSLKRRLVTLRRRMLDAELSSQSNR